MPTIALTKRGATRLTQDCRKNSGPHQGIGKLIEGFVPAGTVISPHRTGWDFESSIDVRNLFPILAAP
jgi:hypothetical protein